MTLKKKLIKEAEIFAKSKGYALGRLSTIVFNRGNYLKDLGEDNRSLRIATYEYAMKIFQCPKAWEEALSKDYERRRESRDRQKAAKKAA